MKWESEERGELGGEGAFFFLLLAQDGNQGELMHSNETDARGR